MTNKAKDQITGILKDSLDGSRIEAYRSIEYAAERLAQRERSIWWNAFRNGMVVSALIGLVILGAETWADPFWSLPPHGRFVTDSLYIDSLFKTGHVHLDPITSDTESPETRREYDSLVKSSDLLDHSFLTPAGRRRLDSIVKRITAQ